jgi:hypothetical protein
MTVSELIEQLKSYPSDMRVLTLGYEGGLNDIEVKWDSVVFNVNNTDTWYMGTHDYAKYMDSEDNGTECVIIGRGK